MRKHTLTMASIALVAIALLPVAAEATNGYFAHGYGVQSKGVAGAGVALPWNTISPATNPALNAFVGKRFDLELALFNPNRSYGVAGAPSGYPGTFGLAPGEVISESTLFAIPALGANWRLSDTDTLGFAIYGNGGMNTDYASPTFGASPTGVDLQQMFFAPTWSHQLGSSHSLGVSPILAYQRFCAEGLAAFSPFSSDANALSDNGYENSLGYGARLGYFGSWSDTLDVGASYQTRIYMGEMDKYAGLFAEGGAFDIPQNFAAGIVVKPSDRIDVLFDVQRIFYSAIPAVANPLLPNLGQAPLGSDGGAGFGWKDVTAIKTGVQFRTGESWTWRAGYSHAGQPIPEEEVLFNILAPGVMEDHITVGLTKTWGSGEFHFAITRALEKTLSGPNALEAPGQQTIGLTMDQWEFAVGYSFGFR